MTANCRSRARSSPARSPAATSSSIATRSGQGPRLLQSLHPSRRPRLPGEVRQGQRVPVLLSRLGFQLRRQPARHSAGGRLPRRLQERQPRPRACAAARTISRLLVHLPRCQRDVAVGLSGRRQGIHRQHRRPVRNRDDDRAGRTEFPGRCQLEALARERHGPVPCAQRAFDLFRIFSRRHQGRHGARQGARRVDRGIRHQGQRRGHDARALQRADADQDQVRLRSRQRPHGL